MKDKIKNDLLLIAFLALMALVLFLFHDWLNDNSNALMVLITFVYVVATFEICKANIKSAEASREQLAESKRQFEETRRLQIAPRLLIRSCSDVQNVENELQFFLLPDNDAYRCRLASFCVSIENVGMGAATEFSLKCSELSLLGGCKENLDTVVYPKDGHTFLVTIGATQQGICDRKSVQESIELRYKDILENTYVQKITLDLLINEEYYVHLNELHVSKAEIVKE